MSSKRLAVNMMATYGRSVVAAALSLFSSRWILAALGQVDFGLYSVVGSLIVFIVFLNSVMANSAARFFSYSMGRDDSEEVCRWFNSALSIHLCMAVLLVAVGYFLGDYAIRNILTIPLERVAVCLLVFRLSLISAFVSMISVPYVAMFTAKQKIAELAVFGLLQSVFSFALAWGLKYGGEDKIIMYSAGMVAIVVLIQGMQMVMAHWRFEECRIRAGEWFQRNRFFQILGFASWNLIGSGGAMLRGQGTAVLLNLYFGPKVNASYGIANQLSTQSNQLAAAMVAAFSPEITASEGRGDRSRVLDLSNMASKYGTFLIMLFAAPLMVEMPFVLKLWLHQPPLFCAIFCNLILVAFLIERLTIGSMLAVNAKGRIAAYQAVVGGINLMTLPIAWLFLELGFAPTSVVAAFIVTMIGMTYGRLWFAEKLLGTTIKMWWLDVVLPSIQFGSAAFAGAMLPTMMLDPSIGRLMCAGLFSALFSIGVWGLFVVKEQERMMLSGIRLKVREKFARKMV